MILLTSSFFTIFEMYFTVFGSGSFLNIDNELREALLFGVADLRRAACEEVTDSFFFTLTVKSFTFS